jgi:hypothetical protein
MDKNHDGKITEEEMHPPASKASGSKASGSKASH